MRFARVRGFDLFCQCQCFPSSSAQKARGLQIECEKVVTSIEVVGIKLDSVLEGVTTFASQDMSLQDYRLLSLSAEGAAPPKKILRSLWLRLNRVFEQISGSVDISPHVANLAEQKVPLDRLVWARYVL